MHPIPKSRIDVKALPGNYAILQVRNEHVQAERPLGTSTVKYTYISLDSLPNEELDYPLLLLSRT